MLPADSKVLLVDDDPAMLRLLGKWLERAGYPVCTAGDGRAAITAMEAEQPAVLITDWEMPGMDGLELCRRVRQMQLAHYLYVIFLTVKSSSESVVAGLEVGADDFLIKPVDQGELLAHMRAGLRILDLEHKLRRTACTDPLTGLLTQRSFYELLEKEWERSKRFHLPLSCVMIDLDFFKRINDTQGHPAGDAVLKAAADLLLAGSRASDTVSRYGGEEFCVLLPETTEADAALWAERIRKKLAEMSVTIAGKEIRITGSFGAAQRHEDTLSPEALVDLADQALMCAKQSGRDRVVAFSTLGEADEHNLVQSIQYEGLFDGVTAGDVMAPLAVCLRETDTVGQAAEFFLLSRINSIPVVNAQGRLAGMLSEKDLLAAIASLHYWQRPVSEFMKPNVVTYEERAPIRGIYEFLCRVSIRRVVIVKDGYPTGTLSRGTLLRWFRNLVAVKGLWEMPEPTQRDYSKARLNMRRLTATARELASRASAFERKLREPSDNVSPMVVGSASGMQELLNDILSYSREPNRSGELFAAPHDKTHNGCFMD
jgi:two-component system, cell cycle response regulator